MPIGWRAVRLRPSAPVRRDLAAQGVDPADLPESRKVRVGRVDIEAVLDRDRGHMGVGDELSGRVVFRQQRAEDIGVPFGGTGNPHDGNVQPAADDAPDEIGPLRVRDDSGVGEESHNRRERLPRKADTAVAVQCAFEPLPGWLVLGGFLVEGVDEEVGVDEHYL